jgi:hypothetical protein
VISDVMISCDVICHAVAPREIKIKMKIEPNTPLLSSVIYDTVYCAALRCGALDCTVH